MLQRRTPCHEARSVHWEDADAWPGGGLSEGGRRRSCVLRPAKGYVVHPQGPYWSNE